MPYTHKFPYRIIMVLVLVSTLLGTLPPGQALAATTTTLEATDDARTQAGSPDVNFGSDFLRFLSLNGHRSFAKFDLLALPANVVIDSAELQLNFVSALVGPNDVELGRADGAWDEATITWNNQPAITFGGPVKTVTANGVYTFDVTALVRAWHNGAAPNHGFAMRGNGGPQVVADSKETGVAPKLVVTYRETVPGGPRPDLGDAPDSTNHVGIANTAYPGVPGNFPTVWDGTPAGQPAGPRHENLTGEGILGDFLSRENEADTGPDQDTQNNILNGGTDNANNDRADDGWRNRSATFANCVPTTLTIRVTKANAAQLNRMFLNVWFDGAHDGDWDDNALCTPTGEALQVPSTEWIVQDYFVDLTGIPGGGFADITVNTAVVLNTTPNPNHWMRFSLSETRAVQTPNGRADGRGPNPNSAAGAFRFGETEDVLQRTPPPGQDGQLTLEKSVDTTTTPVRFGDMVTYHIVLRNTGGNQPVQAQIRDELPYPLHIHPRIVNGVPRLVVVRNPTGSAAPLQATMNIKSNGPEPSTQVVKWQGTLAPNSEIKLTFDVHVLPLCRPNQQTETLRNIAQARPPTGADIADEATFTAACPSYDGLFLSQGTVFTGTLDPILDTTNVALQAKMTNNNANTVTVGLLHSTSTSGAPAAGNQRFLKRLTLAPGETKTFDYTLPSDDSASNTLGLPGDGSVTSNLSYCVLPAGDDYGDDTCLDAQRYPHLRGSAPPLSVAARSNDLGDAPDSTNHPSAPMAAYAGVQASFPTVFDPATGQPQGPRHRTPLPFHLGPQVSREVEADIGPDQDPLNNIVPPANDPDNDRFDDGVQPNLWVFNHCQTTTIPVRVLVSPQAAAWFQQQNKKAFLNVWLDGNRDGDWADGVNCAAGQDAVEQIVIDHPVDVVALGAGAHIVNVPTRLVPWPAQLAQRPAWARVTLSERESNKTLQFGTITYGDGRGYAQAFETGETEDYFAHPVGVPGNPDLAVNLGGALRHEGTGEQAAFKIDYANIGARLASGATLTFKKPEQLRDVKIILLQAPGIPATDIVDANGTLTFKLPALQPGASGAITLRWAAFPSSVAGNLSAQAQVTLSGDAEASNNQATATVARTPATPLVGVKAGGDKAWALRETTCRTTVDLSGRGTPGSIVNLLLDGTPVGSTLVDTNGSFFAPMQLTNGSHDFAAIADGTSNTLATGRIVVDNTLPIDPLSLSFTDRKGNTFHPSTLGFSFGASNPSIFLRSGETYEVGVNSCGSDPNIQIELSIIAILIGLRDDDGDGRYTGSFTYNPAARTTAATASETVGLNVRSGDTLQSFALALGEQASVVRDATTGQPLAGAVITATAALPGNTSAWPATALGQPNPQTTESDGVFAVMLPGGPNRLEVTRDGYQPYRSLAFDENSAVPSVALTPAISDAPTHRVYITETGFEPAVLRAPAGSVVEWVNLSLSEHSTTSATWDSGALEPGQSYRVRLDASSGASYADATNLGTTATIIVEEQPASTTVFLPFIGR